MDLQPDFAFPNHITAYGSDWLLVDGKRYTQSMLLSARRGILPWPYAHYMQLDQQAFACIAELSPEIVIFGSGERLKFPKSDWIRLLIQRQIGIETMDLHAACRTYNILAAEGRNIILAALLETP